MTERGAVDMRHKKPALTNLGIPLGTALVLLALVLAVKPVLGQNGVVTEANIRNAILDPTQFTQDQLNQMDLNGDGKVDVADLVALVQPPVPVPDLRGQIWATSVSFTNKSTMGANYGTIATSSNFIFAVDIPATGSTATVVQVKGFDPTKPALAQNLSQPGQLPGANRASFSLSTVIPIGTQFVIEETANELVLTNSASPITISADAASNPIKAKMQRFWEFHLTKNPGAPACSGTVTEQTIGFLPTQPLISSGTVLLTQYSPDDLSALTE